jgi:hypothetical protein
LSVFRMTNRYLNHFQSPFPKIQTFTFMSYDQEIVRVETLCASFLFTVDSWVIHGRKNINE